MLQISAADAGEAFDSFLCLLNMLKFSPLSVKVGLLMIFLHFLLLGFNSFESIFLGLFGLLNLKLVNHMNVFDSGLEALFFFHVFRALTAIACKAEEFFVTIAARTKAFATHRDLFTTFI